MHDDGGLVKGKGTGQAIIRSESCGLELIESLRESVKPRELRLELWGTTLPKSRETEAVKSKNKGTARITK